MDRMRLLRWLELALAVGAAGLLVVAGWVRPAGFAPSDSDGAVASERSHQVPPLAETGGADRTPPVVDLLDSAAQRHNLPPHLVEAVAFWESGWDQGRVSDTGAVGLMQVQPDVAGELGPRLLGHAVNLQDAAQNADIGAAILRAYIDDQGGDVWKGLAAYYQGPQSLADDGPLPDTQAYADGIQAIQARLDQGQPAGG
jgi:soluble lytic murein transglycosylase-like protein